MKYIRTKDGRILIAPDLYNNGGIFLASDPPMFETRNAKNECGYIVCHDEIKQADTIEELCDEFVVIDKTWEEPLHIVLDTTDDMESYLPSEIYGAIWTDKGLIYVAKMNDKGELELL